ncbi:MAG: glycosyltransferase [Calothrix sp. FI2-JRJ7]|nr:glycosyltransferase [Calothrix sp. FI2-JRJ7]
MLHSHYTNFDIIVVDDGSSDNTYQDVIETFAHEHRVNVFTKAKQH